MAETINTGANSTMAVVINSSSPVLSVNSHESDLPNTTSNTSNTDNTSTNSKTSKTTSKTTSKSCNSSITGNTSITGKTSNTSSISSDSYSSNNSINSQVETLNQTLSILVDIVKQQHQNPLHQSLQDPWSSNINRQMFRDQNGSYVLFAFIVYYCFKIINVPIAEYRSALDTAQMPFHHRDPQRNSMQGCSYEVVLLVFFVKFYLSCFLFQILWIYSASAYRNQSENSRVCNPDRRAPFGFEGYLFITSSVIVFFSLLVYSTFSTIRTSNFVSGY